MEPENKMEERRIGIRNIFKRSNERQENLKTLPLTCPIKPRENELVRYWKDSPSHVGSFKYAVDIITPDPNVNPLVVYSPVSGIVTSIIQEFDEFGNSPAFNDKLNFLTIQLDDGITFVQLCHIGKNSAINNEGIPLKVGDRVVENTPLAKTGANGWMTDPRHLHIMAGKWDKTNPEGFYSIPIHFKDAPDPYSV